jgi:hypothetical protein
MRAWRLAGRAAIALGVVSLAGGLGATAATAQPVSTSEVTAAAAADNPGLPPEARITIPGGTNEAVGDVLGLGYEQVIRIKGSKVEILDPSLRGGKVRLSFEAGARQNFPTQRPDLPGFPSKTYAGLVRMATVDPGREASRLAVVGSHIYVSNILANDDHTAPAGSEIRKYEVYMSGAYAAFREMKKYRKTLNGIDDRYAVTALDAFMHEGREYLAYGLNTEGVRVARGDVEGLPTFRTVHADWDSRGGVWTRDMVTVVQLGTDDQNRLLLIAGKITYEHPAIVATDLRVGEKDGPNDTDVWHHTYLWKNNDRGLDLWDLWNERYEWPELIEFGTIGPNKRPMVAISWPTRNRTSFLYPETGVTWNWTDGLAPTTAVRFFTDPSGDNRVVVRRLWAGPVLGMDHAGGWVWHYDLGDDDIPNAIPGYRAWSLSIDNRSRSDVTLTPYRGGSRIDGCWLGTDLRTSGTNLPSDPISVPLGGRAGPYITAQSMLMKECWGDNEGVFYVQVAPKSAPDQTQLVKVIGGPGGLRIDQQVGGGGLTARLEQDGATGYRLVVADQHGAPTPAGAPTLTAKRLTPESTATKVTDSPDDPSRPVYRFTVSNQKWQVPGADQLSNVTLPVPTVEASTDQENWTALGTTTSPLAPSRAGTEVTLGDSTFYWQTTPGATDYRYFRLTLPGGVVSEAVDVESTEAPAPTTAVKSVALIGDTRGPLQDLAALRPNGLDQAVLRLSLDSAATGIELDPDADPELYDRVYYRDEVTKALLTGLGDPARARKATMFTTVPGQYADGSTGGNSPTFAPVNVSTDDGSAGQTLRAYFKADGKNATVLFSNQPIVVQAAKGVLELQGTAGNGMVVNGCAEGACVLQAPTAEQPALHSMNGKTISLQLASSAIAGSLSLPLVSETEHPEKIALMQSRLSYNANPKVTLQDAHLNESHWPTITTHLVTHGEFVRAENVYIKAKG